MIRQIGDAAHRYIDLHVLHYGSGGTHGEE